MFTVTKGQTTKLYNAGTHEIILSTCTFDEETSNIKDGKAQQNKRSNIY